MFQNLRRSVATLAAAACLAALVPAGAAATVVNRIVATIDGDPVTLFELKQFARKTIRGRDLTSADRSGLLDALILEKIIDKESRAQGLGVPESEIDAYIKDVMERNKLDEMQLRQALEAQGIDYQSYREQIRSEVQRQRLIAREIRGKVNISPEEIERYYEANKQQYARAARTRVAHIVFLVPETAPEAAVTAARSKADDAWAELNDGADFAELAEERSDDGGADGGMLGWFKPGELVDSLDETVQDLDEGAYSRPVRGPQGFHILKVVERESAGYEPLEEHSEQIKEKLYAAALEERYERWIGEELRKRHHVEIR
jgi:peptidyl-prolyl cis-trans isomerase SurA